eukprot:13410206-Alexandrium_andersonii.AAC.1
MFTYVLECPDAFRRGQAQHNQIDMILCGHACSDAFPSGAHAPQCCPARRPCASSASHPHPA